MRTVLPRFPLLLLLLLCTSLLLSAPLSFASASEAGAADDANPLHHPPPVDPDTAAAIHKMRVKVLKEELAERGLECEGCMEKDSFVDMLLANWHLPKGQRKPEAAAAGGEGGKKIPDKVDWRDAKGKEEMDDIMQKLKGAKSKEEMAELLSKLQKQSGIKFDISTAEEREAAAQKAKEAADRAAAGGEEGKDEL